MKKIISILCLFGIGIIRLSAQTDIHINSQTKKYKFFIFSHKFSTASYGKWQESQNCNINIIIDHNSTTGLYEGEFFKDGVAGQKLDWKFISSHVFLKIKIENGYMYTIDGEFIIDNKYFATELDVVLNKNSMVLLRLKPAKNLTDEDYSNIEFSEVTDDSKIFD